MLRRNLEERLVCLQIYKHGDPARILPSMRTASVLEEPAAVTGVSFGSQYACDRDERDALGPIDEA